MEETEPVQAEEVTNGHETGFRSAAEVLLEQLNVGSGSISSRALRQLLEDRGFEHARQLVSQLRFYDFEANPERLGRWYHCGRSFVSAIQHEGIVANQEQAALNSERVDAAAQEDDDVARPQKARKRQQEEARLGTYIAATLNDLYASEYGPDDASYVFDVHSSRSGSELENVDILAVHWRSDTVVDLVAVEAKLYFGASLVQQANNYRRFADRVWIALPIRAEVSDAALALREQDPLLFDHVVDAGLGVIACKPRQGRSYQPVPIHWPRRQRPDPVERESFIDRYRWYLEEAQVIAPKGRDFPRLR